MLSLTMLSALTYALAAAVADACIHPLSRLLVLSPGRMRGRHT